ncbi:hypothetical protein MOSE0_E02058 [Monosporozyma servazzii]
MMQFAADNTTMYQATTIKMDLDIVFSDGTSMEPFTRRGPNKRCVEEPEQSFANNSTCNKRPRYDREGHYQGKGLDAITHNNISHQNQQVGATQPSVRNHISLQNSNNCNNNNANHGTSSHLQFIVDMKLNRCIDGIVEYENYSQRNAYGYRDH